MRKQEYILTAAEEKRLAKEHFRKRVLEAQDKLINSQMSLALGAHVLFRIEYDPDTNKKSKPQMVTDPQEIQDYLAGETQNNTDYYFLLLEKPDNRAIDSLFDRAFGKPQTPLEDQPDATNNLGVIAYPTALPELPEQTQQQIESHDKISLEATTEADTSPSLPS